MYIYKYRNRNVCTWVDLSRKREQKLELEREGDLLQEALAGAIYICIYINTEIEMYVPGLISPGKENRNSNWSGKATFCRKPWQARVTSERGPVQLTRGGMDHSIVIGGWY